MIARLTGHLHTLGLDEVVLDVGGVGYHVHVPIGTQARVREQDDGRVTLLVHTAVREDAIQLFGFATAQEKAVYKKLISINGIGPKLGLSVLSDLSVSEVVGAVRSNDFQTFTRVSGIGKKTAQRLVLELANSFDDLPAHLELASNVTRHDTAEVGLLGDLRSALSNLEYKPATIDHVIAQLEPASDDEDLQALLRRALKILRG